MWVKDVGYKQVFFMFGILIIVLLPKFKLSQFVEMEEEWNGVAILAKLQRENSCDSQSLKKETYPLLVNN